MNDQKFETQKARVERYFHPWSKQMGLLYGNIHLSWRRTWKDPIQENGGAGASMVLFDCYTDWRYSRTTLVAYLPAIEEIDDAELEYSVVHELCHVLLKELQPSCGCDTDHRDHEEHAASALARAYVWIRDSALDQPDLWRTEPPADEVKAG